MTKQFFSAYLIDNRDYYGSCLLTKDIICDIIKFVYF